MTVSDDGGTGSSKSDVSFFALSLARSQKYLKDNSQIYT